MLGVRRENVTLAASALQRRSFISDSRGYVMLPDEGALQNPPKASPAAAMRQICETIKGLCPRLA